MSKDDYEQIFSPEELVSFQYDARGAGVLVVPSQSYIPQQPTIRQKLFIDLDKEKEVFYGGAAGGGKSSCLLMEALKYVHVTKYSALILRRTYADLAKPGAIMDRSKEWLKGTNARWNEQKKEWTFPSGAKLTFGYLDTENDKYQYQGAEFQFIGFDELTQFTESQYRYLFSRLRRLSTSDIPIKMRSASNPGGIGGKWVYERFVPENFTPDDAVEEKVWIKEGVDEETGKILPRYFVPARLDDNPHLDRDEYELSLSELDTVTRAQLRRGDWQIQVRGDILYMWDERFHVITWSQFEKVYGSRHIPLHWKLGIFQDWGTTDAHPCVTSWFATASANSPLAGSVFLYREMTVVKSTAREVKEKIYNLMIPNNEIPRCQYWEMSHEASSERLEYNWRDKENEYSLPFINWQTGKNRGIEQLKGALDIREKDKGHPFNQGIYGCPKLFIIVDDNELLNPKTDAGIVRGRSEAVMYKWNVPKSGEPPTKLEPFALYNDAMDTWRAAAITYFPQATALTTSEVIQQKYREKTIYANELGEDVSDAAQISRQMAWLETIRELNESGMGLDYFGQEKENEGVTDISEGW